MQEEDKHGDTDKDCYCYNPAGGGGGGIEQRGVGALLPVLRLELPSPLDRNPSAILTFFGFPCFVLALLVCFF